MSQTKAELLEPKADFTISGTTPTLTIGDAGAEDTKIVFDGNAQDFYIGLDDSADDLLIGLGSTVGTTPIISVDENKDVNIPDGTLTISNTGNEKTLNLISTDADASHGPYIRMFRNSSSAADEDLVGRIDFANTNDADEEENYLMMYSRIEDASNGNESGKFYLDTMVNGTTRTRMYIKKDVLVINEDGIDSDFRVESQGNANMIFVEASADRLMFSKSTTAIGTVGMVYDSQQIFNTRSGNSPLAVNRLSNDGTLFACYQAGSEEGGITVSGSTVSISGFTGVHWSRLADNSKPTILRGTIMDSIDEMCDWYQAVAEVAESTDDDGTVTPAHQVKESIALGSKSVGDAITFTSNGTEYTGTIVKEGDVKHNKCKVSDTADSKKVYGIFSNWDDADDGLDGDVNDMNIAQVGTFIVRVNKDVTVSAGDLLVSNGDGTAKKQDDDIIRSKTVAKVNSNIKVETYSDGSYTVPCTLHC